jgi:hypothetical protein
MLRNAIVPPPWHPTDAVDLGHGVLAETGVVDAQEPLLGGAEDERVLARQQCGYECATFSLCTRRPGGAQVVDDALVRLEDLGADVGTRVHGEAALGVHRRQRRQPVLLPDLEVLVPVARRGVHAAGAGVGGDVVSNTARDGRSNSGWRNASRPSRPLRSTRSVAPR